MKFTHDFRADLSQLIHEAEHGDPFAFVRFADGERAILDNKVDTRTADGWKIGSEWMRKALCEALVADIPRYYTGIPCPCCSESDMEFFRRSLFSKSSVRGGEGWSATTYSNLFVNGNYDTALPWLRKLARNWCVVSSAWGSDIRVPADWSSVPDLPGLVHVTYLDMLRAHRPVLVAAGPLGKILIHQYWLHPERRKNTILDIGSALDPDLFSKIGTPDKYPDQLAYDKGWTRSYHNPNHPNRKKICVWDSHAHARSIRTEFAGLALDSSAKAPLD